MKINRIIPILALIVNGLKIQSSDDHQLSGLGIGLLLTFCHPSGEASKSSGSWEAVLFILDVWYN